MFIANVIINSSLNDKLNNLLNPSTRLPTFSYKKKNFSVKMSQNRN